MAAGEERSVGGRWQGSRQGGEDLQTREPFGRSLMEVRAPLAFFAPCLGACGGSGLRKFPKWNVSPLPLDRGL